MKHLLCYIIGHKWELIPQSFSYGAIAGVAGVIGALAAQSTVTFQPRYKRCRRCKKMVIEVKK